MFLLFFLFLLFLLFSLSFLFFFMFFFFMISSSLATGVVFGTGGSHCRWKYVGVESV